jgi:hypothetical protein
MALVDGRRGVLVWAALYRGGCGDDIPLLVVRIAAPQLMPLEGSEVGAAIELLAELLLEAARDAALVPSAGPALIDDIEEEG